MFLNPKILKKLLKEAVHNNAEMMRLLREDGQKAFEQNHTREEFMELFGKNYLED